MYTYFSNTKHQKDAKSKLVDYLEAIVLKNI